jgi:hypothetical protein
MKSTARGYTHTAMGGVDGNTQLETRSTPERWKDTPIHNANLGMGRGVWPRLVRISGWPQPTLQLKRTELRFSRHNNITTICRSVHTAPHPRMWCRMHRCAYDCVVFKRALRSRALFSITRQGRSFRKKRPKRGHTTVPDRHATVGNVLQGCPHVPAYLVGGSRTMSVCDMNAPQALHTCIVV